MVNLIKTITKNGETKESLNIANDEQAIMLLKDKRYRLAEGERGPDSKVGERDGIVDFDSPIITDPEVITGNTNLDGSDPLPDPAVDASDEDVFESMTRNELIKIASDKGIKSTGHLNKAQLIEAIKG